MLATGFSRRRFVRLAGAAGLAAATSYMLSLREMRAGVSLRIGALYNLTGELASIDVPGLQGMRLAAGEINQERGGLLGRSVELIAIDGRSDPATIARAAAEMIDTYQVAAIGGLNDSDGAEAAGPVTQRAGIPFVTAGATLPALPEMVGDFFFMACYGDDTQAFAIADFAAGALGARTAWLLVNEDSEYTAALARYFAQRFTRQGGRIVLEDSYPLDTTDFSSPIVRLRALSPTPEVLFAAALPAEAGPLVLQLRQAGFAQPILSGDGFDTPDLPATAGSSATRVFYSTHVAYDDPDPAVQRFVATYRAAYGSLPDTAFAALGYDTLNLIADAVVRAGSSMPAAIRAALADTRAFQGVTGSIRYAPGQRRPEKPVSIVEIRDGRPVFVGLVRP